MTDQAPPEPAGTAMTREAGRLLPAVIGVLSSAGHPDMILPSVVGLILDATNADACFLHRWDPVTRRLELVAANDRFSHMVGKVSLAEGEGVAGWVAKHRQPVVIPRNKRSDPRYKYIPGLGGEHFTSMASVPVVSGRGGLMGVLNLHTVDELHFGPSEMEFISATAKLVGTTLDNSDLFARLVQKEAELEALVASTLRAQEAERRRVAREIHDGVTQMLVAMTYRLQAGMAVAGKAAETDLAAALEITDLAIEESRRAIRDLRPSALEDLGLVPSLRELAAAVQTDSGIDISVRSGGEMTLDPDVAMVLYRVAQEALANTAKHAGAERVTITLDAGPERISLIVEDDGVGFDTAMTGPGTGVGETYGLSGMRERVELAGGSFRITSEAAAGTRIDVHIPT